MLTKTLMVMKLTAIFLLAVCLQVSATGFSQGVTLSFRNASLERVFKEVKKQTGYSFVYTRELLEQTDGVTIKTENLPVQEALERCFQGMPLTFVIRDKFIVIKPRAVVPELLKVVDTARPGASDSKVKLQGRVVDGVDPLGGATVTIRKVGHSSASGTTDVNGWFRLTSLAEGVYTLEVSYIGFEKTFREVTITDKPQTIVLVMKKSTSTLDAIQTTAYSKTTLRFNTGDISTVTSEEIARNPVSNVLQALEGRVAGMQVTQSTGKVNGGFAVQIRSLNTLSAGAATPTLTFTTGGQPLYIIDGVEYPASGTLPMAFFNGYQAQLYGNALNYLDPSLIESINVLKGADATAVYGSRGAFGVILITTKKGKASKPSLTINASQGISTLGVAPKLLDLQGYLGLRREAFANDSVKPAATDFDVNGVWDTTKSTDWKKFFLGSHASTTRVNATYTGGTSNSNYVLGANYSAVGNIERSKGLVRQGGMNFSLNTATNDRKFMMALSGSYGTNLDNTVPVDFASGGLTQAPDAPYPFLPDGKLNWANGANGSNPAAGLNALYNNNTDNLIANTTLTFTPVAGLSFSAVGGFNLLSAKEFVAKPTSYFNPATFTASQLTSTVNLYRIRTLSADPRAEYVHTWGKARLDLIAGGSLRDRVDQRTAIVGTGFATDQLLLSPSNASTISQTLYNSTPTRYIGGFAVINFRWADKYILDLSGRRDGSSVFGNNRQFGDFGSVAGGWIISEEPWFKGIRPVIDFLKLKASYGLVGGSALPAYSYINTYGASGNSYGGGLSLTTQNLANPYLHWETDRNFEAGMNVDLFKGRLNLEAIYFTNKAGDQLTNQPLASITGFTSFVVNSAAQIRSYGAEFTVNTKNIQSRDFSWTSRILLTIPRTKLLAFPGLGNLLNNKNYVIGKPITGFKVIKYAGVDPATGYYNFYNAAGKKGAYLDFFGPNVLSNSDRTEFVDMAPKWYGSVLNTLSYKNFSMDFLITVMDKTGPSYLAFLTFAPGTPNTNIPADIAATRWKKPGDVAAVMRATQGLNGFLGQANFNNSTAAFSNATYARLQNLSLSYRLPARLVRKAGMSAFSVYVAGQNLLTVSRYKGLDPESLTTRIPPSRVFTGGLTVGF
jgi:TonB-linked SusC/RagA family outer membrane protein